MESKTHAPSFTVSLRGYDRMEVDEYLDSLAEALGQVEIADDRNRGLQAHIDRLNARIADLEGRIAADVPRTGAVLGERITLLLRSAEETAADTIGRAQAEAAEMLEQAGEEVAAAEDQARGAILRGDEEARRLESSARVEAEEIVAEAEARASARTRQIEQWAEQVISHTRAEEARMLSEQQERREQGEADLQALADQRDEVAANMSELRDFLGHALGLVGPRPSLLPAVEPQATAVDGEPALDGEAALDGDAEPDAEAGGEEAVLDEAQMADEADEAGEAGHLEVADEAGDLEVADEAGELEAVVDVEVAEVAGEAEVAGQPQMGAQAESGIDGGEVAVAGPSLEVEDDPDADAEMPWPACFSPVRADDNTADDDTGEIGIQPGHPGEADDFDTKFEAWVTGAEEGPKHFRRL